MLKLKEKFISKLATLLNVNLQKVADYGRGISYETNPILNGELNAIQTVLKGKQNEKMVFFDVGANVGEYSSLLMRHFPNAIIHSFEPNHSTFRLLEDKLNYNDNIRLNNNALGSIENASTIYYYQKDHLTGHASIYKEVFSEVHGDLNIISQDIPMTTLDQYCKKNEFDRIHWLKIDTEGHELEILKGARSMISEGKIDYIQFEFNEMNIISRVFLKDFYDLLCEYQFYRISEKGLFPLGNYSAKNEVFKIQNILAMKNKYRLVDQN